MCFSDKNVSGHSQPGTDHAPRKKKVYSNATVSRMFPVTTNSQYTAQLKAVEKAEKIEDKDADYLPGTKRKKPAVWSGEAANSMMTNNIASFS